MEEILLGCLFKIKGDEADTLKVIMENQRVLANNCYSLERIMELEADKEGLSLKVSKKELNTILAAIDNAKESIMLAYNRLEKLGLISYKDTATE